MAGGRIMRIRIAPVLTGGAVGHSAIDRGSPRVLQRIRSFREEDFPMPAIATPAIRALPPQRTPRLSLAIFETAIGWFGVLGSPAGVSRLTFGQASPLEIYQALGTAADEVDETDWNANLRRRIEQYAQGHEVNFDQVQVLRARPLTAFQQRVVEIVRGIPRGETKTYGEVARLAGSPGAARAVGQVMATNPVPIIIPCHRVVSSSGGLGGFSAAGGVQTKRWMLDREAEMAPQ